MNRDELLAMSRRIRLAIHRHDPIECWCELTADDAVWQDPRPIHNGGKAGFHCPTCWTPHGERHELSCPEVTPEQLRAYLDGTR